MAEVIHENKIGIAKGSKVEEAVNANFRGETSEVGLYLAMSRQAQREGYPEVAAALQAIAWDEAWHAARFAELNGLISESTRENIQRMLEGERGASRGKAEAAKKAAEAGLGAAQGFFDESSRDEGRHAKALEGLLKRYFS